MYTLLDYGCGVGNGFYPLISTFGYDKLRVNGCDISKTAVSFIKTHHLFNEKYVDVKQADLVNDPIPFPDQSADFGLFLFVLSAISPDKFDQTL